jgi:hypothetical protein
VDSDSVLSSQYNCRTPTEVVIKKEVDEKIRSAYESFMGKYPGYCEKHPTAENDFKNTYLFLHLSVDIIPNNVVSKISDIEDDYRVLVAAQTGTLEQLQQETPGLSTEKISSILNGWVELCGYNKEDLLMGGVSSPWYDYLGNIAFA